MIRLIYIYVIIIISFSSCSTVKSKYEFLKSELSLTSNFNELQYEEFKLGSIKIKKPILKNLTLRNEFEKQYLKDTVGLDCKGEIELKYHVNSESDNFISITKEVVMQFCENYPSDVVFFETYNYLYYNDTVYDIKLELDDALFEKIYLSKLNNECANEFENFTGSYLFFEHNKAMCFVWYDKVCYYDLPIELEEKDITFIPY